MSSLRDIRRQLKSVENIKKITDTMERVAAARLRHAQLKAEHFRPYFEKLREILQNLAFAESHSLFEKRKVQKIGVVIVSADKGLSGSYNANIFQAADRFLKTLNHDQVELILFGQKSIEYYKNKKWKIRSKAQLKPEKTTNDEIFKMSKELLDLFLAKEFDEIWFVYTKFISIVKRSIVVEKFLNVEKKSEEPNQNRNYIFEPSLEEILEEIIPKYIQSQMQIAFYESYASELAARIIAMQTASKNSEEMITQLTLTKNKIRQAEITKEMIEITSGVEGQN